VRDPAAEGNAITDSEFEHLSMCAHVIEEAKALDDAIVQIDEFCLSQFANVYFGHWSLRRVAADDTAALPPNVEGKRRADAMLAAVCSCVQLTVRLGHYACDCHRRAPSGTGELCQLAGPQRRAASTWT